MVISANEFVLAQIAQNNITMNANLIFVSRPFLQSMPLLQPPATGHERTSSWYPAGLQINCSGRAPRQLI
jgi:hypothetical protein